MGSTDDTAIGTTDQPNEVFAGGGEMGARMRAMDWSQTPLGPVSNWPQSLRTSVHLILESRYPMMVNWGNDLLQFYNDAYRPILGTSKHPAALGAPVAEIWPEAYDVIGPLFHGVLDTGQAVWFDDLLLPVDRHGFLEETHFGFSYSPIRAEAGQVAGVLVTCQETTHQVFGERQLALLRDLAAEAADARTIVDACAFSARALETDPLDLPFALIYLVDREHQRAVLAGRAGIAGGHPAAPESVALDDAIWPFAEVLRTNAARLIVGLPATFEALPLGDRAQPPAQALALPIAPSGETGKAGVLIAGLSPYRRFDADYQRFLELVAGQIAAAVANAQAYEEERARADALAELDRAKTLFFSNVSHEFRTPLTLLLGPIEDALTESDGHLSEEERTRLRVAHRNALRLLKLVNTLLDFSRIEAGRVQASYELTDLPGYTAELVSTFRSAVERGGLRLIVDCAPLPDGVVTYVDREMWEKIVFNLLSNALKFTFTGEIEVSLTATGNSSVVRFAVRDTGIGISDDELPRLFERFHRVQGAQARTHEGTGIGLALTQELVKLHGGTVTVASVLGSGSTFIVTIPTGAGHLPPERIDAERKLASTATGAAPYVEEALRWLPSGRDLSGSALAGAGPLPAAVTATPSPNGQSSNPASGHVLVVDDNADMREYIARLLRQRYAVETVPDGAAALAAARTQRPDLVLTDVMMPGLDGFELLRALRADPRTADVPVILLSARADEEARIEGLDAGADDYLIKPFTARELLARVGTHLSLARIRSEANRQEQAARKAAEAERLRLRELFEQAPAAICLLRGPEHVYELANPRYLKLVGSRDVLGKPIREALPELDGQGIFELLDGVYRTGEPFVGDEVAVMMDRTGTGRLEERYFTFVYQPIKDHDGAVEGIFVQAFDMTNQVQARQQLETEIAERARAEALLAGERAVLELIARGVSLAETLDVLARLIEVEMDDIFCSILLLDRDGVHLRHGAAPSLPEAYNRAIDGLEIGLAAGSCGTAAFRGESVIVSDIATDALWQDYRHLALPHGLRACWSTPIRAADGQVLGTFAIYHREPHQPSPTERELVDVLTYLAAIAISRARNEEQRAELRERERAARAAAEAAVRARDEFISIAAHELRTPVAAIKGTAQFALRAKERGRLDLERAEKALLGVHQAVDRLVILIDDLLDVSRLQGGQLALRTERLNLVAQVRGVAEQHRMLLDARYDLALDLPAAPIVVEADPGRLEQVFDNLLSNAVKYSPDGGRITLTLASEDEGVTVAVTDPGIGLPDGTTERIFEPFGRADNARARNLPGMGLGLHVSRRIVELHGGRLWAESAGEGQGTTLRLWLPVVG